MSLLSLSAGNLGRRSLGLGARDMGQEMVDFLLHALVLALEARDLQFLLAQALDQAGNHLPMEGDEVCQII